MFPRVINVDMFACWKVLGHAHDFRHVDLTVKAHKSPLQPHCLAYELHTLVYIYYCQNVARKGLFYDCRIAVLESTGRSLTGDLLIQATAAYAARHVVRSVHSSLSAKYYSDTFRGDRDSGDFLHTILEHAPLSLQLFSGWTLNWVSRACPNHDISYL